MSAASRPAEAEAELRVSVVIPCHDYGRFLDEAVASVLAQTRRVDEVVVIDDGSSDDTAVVVARIVVAQPHVRAISRQPAQGAVATFNDGVRSTTGDLVVILSADDRMSATYVEELERAIVASVADFAYSPMHLFGARTVVWPSREFDRRALARANYVNGSAMFRRSLFDRLGGFDKGFEALGLEDWAFWLSATAKGSVGVRVDGCWLEYRQHDRGSRNPVSMRRVGLAHWSLHRRMPNVIRVRDVCWLASRLALQQVRRYLVRLRGIRRPADR